MTRRQYAVMLFVLLALALFGTVPPLLERMHYCPQNVWSNSCAIVDRVDQRILVRRHKGESTELFLIDHGKETQIKLSASAVDVNDQTIDAIRFDHDDPRYLKVDQKRIAIEQARSEK